MVQFDERTTFQQAVFHDEVNFIEARFAFLKHPPDEGIALNGAVLEAAHLWGIDTLRGYDLRDAFLLGISLAGKRLEGCNATGAVFKNVHTDGWTLDDATIAVTRYIYTDYTRETVKDDEGREREVFKPVAESRVPADGKFGDADNPRFTLETYFFQPHEWNRALNFPRRIQKGILDYLHFFPEYAEVTHGLKVRATPHPEGQKVRMTFAVDHPSLQDAVNDLLGDYMQNLFKPIDEVREELVFRNTEATEEEKALLVADYSQALEASRLKMWDGYQRLSPAERRHADQQMQRLLPANASQRPIVIQNVIQTSAQSSAEARAVATSSATATATARLKLPTLIREVQQIANADLPTEERDELVAMLREIKDALKVNESAQAKGFWDGVWTGLKETVDLAAKYPKLYETGQLLQAAFDAV
ncbi:MAG: hypothetical protein AAGJ10_09255 [Bacteroidota bacterium]